MNAAIYARVSSETQAQEGTIASQLASLRDYAVKHDFHIVTECLDEGYSGTNLIRPGLDRLRDLASSHQIECALILSPDRLARNHVHQFVLLDDFQKQGVKIIFTNHNLGDSPEDRLLLGVQGLFAEYERTNFLVRSRRGRIEHAKQGHISGGSAPYGYRHINKTRDSFARYEIHPDEAEVVKTIYRLATQEKMSLHGIQKYLTKLEVPTRAGHSLWWTSTIMNILRNEAYTGTTHAFKNTVKEPKNPRNKSPYRKVKNTAREPRPREEWIPIQIPQIIDRATFEAARAQQRQNSERSPRNNWRNQYLLRTLVNCGLCGCRLVGSTSSRKLIYYRCPGPKYGGSRRAIPHTEIVSVRNAKLDSLVWDALVDLMDDPARLEAQINSALAAQASPPPTQTPRLDATKKALKTLDAEEERLIDAYRQKAISLDQLKTQKGKLTPRRRELEAALEALTRPQPARDAPGITRAMLGDLSARYRLAMASADFKTKRELVETLITQITLFPDRVLVAGVIPVQDRALSPLLARGRSRRRSPGCLAS